MQYPNLNGTFSYKDAEKTEFDYDVTDESQERKVELAYEGHYYWDMRRWKLSATAFTGIRLHGMKIEKNANGSFTYIYTECDDKDRNFPTKMYRFPMPQAELDNNGAVTQYAEWQ